MEVAETTSGSPIGLFIGMGLLSCFAMIVWLYNLWALIGQMRQEESASGMAKAAWGLSLAAWFTGPCALMFALVAFVMARVETGRIYREESSIASSGPANMASLNAGMLFLFTVLVTVVAILSM